MRKTLYLLRHSEAAAGAGLRDLDRPLTTRGEQIAARVGQYMRSHGIKPDVLIVSTAKRTRDTARFVSEAAVFEGEIRDEPRIYETDTDTLLDVVHEIDENINEAMLVSHNPGLQNFLNLLTGETRAMPPASLAHVVFDVERWADVRRRRGRLELFMTPDELPQ